MYNNDWKRDALMTSLWLLPARLCKVESSWLKQNRIHIYCRHNICICWLNIYRMMIIIAEHFYCRAFYQTNQTKYLKWNGLWDYLLTTLYCKKEYRRKKSSLVHGHVIFLCWSKTSKLQRAVIDVTFNAHLVSQVIGVGQ